MNADKFALKSKGVWGGVIALIPSLALLFGWDASSLAEVEGLGNQIIGGVAAAGALAAIIGRLVAGSELYFWK